MTQATEYWIATKKNPLTEFTDTNVTFGKFGTIQETRHRISANIDITPIPTFGTTGTIGITVAGTLREISIDGKLSDTAANIATFIANIETKMNGTQKDAEATSKMGYHFHDALMDAKYGIGTGIAQYRVAIKSFDWEYIAGAPGYLQYRLELTEIKEI